ncbi:MAG: hypothetical protein ACXU82_03710 [Caulobacteraceae bacterium]
MVAYSFKSSFLPAIHSREKRQTIRRPRKRHARPGEGLQLFTGPRMKPIRLGAASCLAVREIRLDFDANVVELDEAVLIEGEDALNAFAVRDGFNPTGHTDTVLTPWAFMARWWALTHPGQPIFRGILVDWGNTFEATP